jgi:hypothetical protein
MLSGAKHLRVIYEKCYIRRLEFAGNADSSDSFSMEKRLKNTFFCGTENKETPSEAREFSKEVMKRSIPFH